MQSALWSPSSTDNLAIQALQKYAQVSDFQSLHEWSIENPELFWRYVFEDSGVVGNLGVKGITGSGFLGSKFFPDAQLNISDTLLQGSNEQIIITEISESGVKKEYSRSQVRKIANQVAFGLQELGLKEGDVGSSDVQIALATARIKHLTDHMKANPKDFHTRRGLVQLVNERRKHLAYLNKNDHARYLELIKKLGLRR